VRLNGQAIESQEDFYAKLWQTRIGEEVAILILRENKFEVIKLRPVDRRQPAAQPAK
jgi:S1-C subfamily serine protease